MDHDADKTETTDVDDAGDPATIPLTAFFPPTLPDFSGAEIVWSGMRRGALKWAVRRRGRPYVRVESSPLQGQPVHVHGSQALEHDEDHFERGMRAYGPLGYSILRSHAVVSAHLRHRIDGLVQQYELLVGRMMAARTAALSNYDEEYVIQSRLVFWDALGSMLMACENVMALFFAVNDYEGRRVDLGESLVKRRDVAPHRVLESGSFQHYDWWYRHLDLGGAKGRGLDLAARQKAQVDFVARTSRALVREALDDIANTWTADLHRVATRQKHGLTLIDPTHGAAWATEILGDGTPHIGQDYVDSALFVIDANDGPPSQFVVPISIGGLEVLLDSARGTVALWESLVAALIQKAENPTGRVFPAVARYDSNLMPDHLKPNNDEIITLLALISGLSPEYLISGADHLARKSAATAAIDDAFRGWQDANGRNTVTYVEEIWNPRRPSPFRD